MADSEAPTQSGTREGLAMGPIARRLRAALHARLERIEFGRLTLHEGGCHRVFGGRGDGPVATLRVHDPRFYSRVALGGGVGGGEAYMDGYWSCDDLTSLVRLFARNPALSRGLDRGLGRLGGPLRRLLHALRRNTPRGSARNVRDHYDLGNEFFRLFLDPTLTYSCGIFEREDATLEEASLAKYERLCRKLALGPGDHVLEIGCGWGGFAIHAAGRYGCRVTTTTISSEQHALARERVATAGLSARVNVLDRDYRDLEGTYDKLVSIEMIEAVGDRYLDDFFRVCAERLRPDGLMALQAITIRDQLYDGYLRGVDFIQRYVFPGGCLISLARVAQAIARASDLHLFHLEDITAHYPTTLSHWRERFLKSLGEVRALGYPERFIRMWEFYLSYCEAGFLERTIGDVQMVLTKPACERGPIGG